MHAVDWNFSHDAPNAPSYANVKMPVAEVSHLRADHGAESGGQPRRPAAGLDAQREQHVMRGRGDRADEGVAQQTLSFASAGRVRSMLAARTAGTLSRPRCRSGPAGEARIAPFL